MAQVKALIGNIKGPAGKDGNENQIYSTDETVIGKWIDGKPLYRKIIENVMPAVGQIKYIDFNLSDYSYAKINGHMVTAGVSAEPIDGISGTAIWLDSGKIGLKNELREDFGNRTVFIQIEYTKKSDTATT